jgi:predicted polyphosphate/ATP-dependent NAD kinase
MSSEGNSQRRRIGLIVNPIAGIGGRVGLKGSDGAGTVSKAYDLGATPPSPERATEALAQLVALEDQIELLTYPGEMGEQEAYDAGLKPRVLGSIDSGKTTALDSKRAAHELQESGAELLLFVGGDGTARDIYEAVGDEVPVLGIPAGVKMHSSVYAINPRKAANLLDEFLRGRAQMRHMEVMDIDEDQFRQGRVSARLYGYLLVPFVPRLVQGAKAGSAGSGESTRAIAEWVVDQMMDECYYILGPGTTVKAIGDELGIDKTLLGVDCVHQRQLIGKDLNEDQIVRFVEDKHSNIVVTIIGGQGYIFGRGNQQISPRVIRYVGRDNVTIVSTPAKLLSLRGPLLVDTGDYHLDRSLCGYVRIVTGYKEETVWQVDC